MIAFVVKIREFDFYMQTTYENEQKYLPNNVISNSRELQFSALLNQDCILA